VEARPLDATVPRSLGSARRRRAWAVAAVALARPRIGPQPARQGRLLDFLVVLHRARWLLIAAAACTGPADGEHLARWTVSAELGAPASSGQPQAAEPSILVSAVGDCTLGSVTGTFDAALAEHGGDLGYFFAGVAEVLAADDLTIANLETPLTRHPRRPDAHAAFRGKPGYAEILIRGSVEAVDVANNHAMDSGGLGAAETVAALDARGIGSFGWERVFERTVAGIGVVSLGFEGGHLRDRRKITRAVRERKRADNLVIVSFHWGGEGSPRPTPVQYELGRAAIDAGADLVLGHHPHVLQGIERYRGRPIVYSLGNFVFGGDSQPDDMDSIIYQARFSLRAGRVELAGEQVVPVSISSRADRNDYRPRLLAGREKQRVLDRVAELSRALWLPRERPPDLTPPRSW
jgi:poly-gamma-glutamate capsule biosynthesis protein CapA/YwtB (metallophosphatase superfamily)